MSKLYGKKEAAKREESYKSIADEENVMDRNELVFSLSSDFMEYISKILEDARRNAKTAVNLSMVYAYYEIGSFLYNSNIGNSKEGG